MDRYTTVPGGNQQYDRNGNLVHITNADRETVYVYDCDNRLVGVQTVAFQQRRGGGHA